MNNDNGRPFFAPPDLDMHAFFVREHHEQHQRLRAMRPPDQRPAMLLEPRRNAAPIRQQNEIPVLQQAFDRIREIEQELQNRFRFGDDDEEFHHFAENGDGMERILDMNGVGMIHPIHAPLLEQMFGGNGDGDLPGRREHLGNRRHHLGNRRERRERRIREVRHARGIVAEAMEQMEANMGMEEAGNLHNDPHAMRNRAMRRHIDRMREQRRARLQQYELFYVKVKDEQKEVRLCSMCKNMVVNTKFLEHIEVCAEKKKIPDNVKTYVHSKFLASEYVFRQKLAAIRNQLELSYLEALSNSEMLTMMECVICTTFEQHRSGHCLTDKQKGAYTQQVGQLLRASFASYEQYVENMKAKGLELIVERHNSEYDKMEKSITDGEDDLETEQIRHGIWYDFHTKTVRIQQEEKEKYSQMAQPKCERLYNDRVRHMRRLVGDIGESMVNFLERMAAENPDTLGEAIQLRKNRSLADIDRSTEETLGGVMGKPPRSSPHQSPYNCGSDGDAEEVEKRLFKEVKREMKDSSDASTSSFLI